LAETASRTALENALFGYAPLDRQACARTFLEALSMDELLFLAEFLGSCILITSATNMDIWDAIGHRAQESYRMHGRRSSDDADHKLVVLSEFAACCGFIIRFR
jgi:hypothetical protein